LAAEIHIVVAEMLQRRDVVVVVEQRRLAERLAGLPELELAGRLALSLAQVVVVEHQSLSSLLFLFFEHHVERVGVELPVVERLVVVDGVMLLVLLVVPAGQPELLVARLAELLSNIKYIIIYFSFREIFNLIEISLKFGIKLVTLLLLLSLLYRRLLLC
jgi:hypothetical protein